MSTVTPVPTVPKVRTYAADLTATRSLRGITTPRVQTKPNAIATPVMPAKKVATAAPKATRTETKPVPHITPAKVAVVPKPVQPNSRPVASGAAAAAAVPATVEKPIPPFHTLQKKAEKATAPVTKINTDEFSTSQKVQKASVLANPGVETLEVNSKGNTEATIITDTKNNKLTLPNAIIASLSNWWHTKQKETAERKKPKYTVPEADRRKGVIQKATTQTGRSSTDDHEVALARIKAAKKTTRHTVPKPKPVIISTPTPKPQEMSVSEWLTEHQDEIATNRTPTEQVPVSTERTVEPTNTVSDLLTFITTAPETTPKTPVAVTPQIAPIIQPPAEIPPPPIETLVVPQQPIELEPELPTPIVAPVPVARPRIVPTIPHLQTNEQTNESFTPAVPIVTEVLPTIQAAELTLPVESNPEPIPEPAITTPTVPTPVARPRIVPTIPRLQAESPEMPDTLAPEIISSESSAPAAEALTTPSIPHWSQSIAQTRSSTGALGKQGVAWIISQMRRTNHLALGIASACGVIVVVWIGARAIMTSLPSNTASDAVTQTSVFESGIVITPTSPITTKAAILAAVQETSPANYITEVALINPATNLPFTAAELFAMLESNVNITFSEAVANVRIGQYHSAPWIMLQSDDTATIRGGMLTWENTMSTDLAPWFGSSVSSESKTGITLFHDDVIATHDVRILTDKNKNERIVYGFISNNQLLITTSTTAFLNLAEKNQAQ